MEDNLLKLEPPQDSEKKPYAPPRLIVHGSVENVTAGTAGQVTDGEASMFVP